MTAKEFTATYNALPPEAQRQVEDFIAFINQKYVPKQASPISRVRGTPGKELLRFAGIIEADDLVLMQQAIEEDCERIEDEPALGMWSDRDDLADSAEYVRELRHKEWGENS